MAGTKRPQAREADSSRNRRFFSHCARQFPGQMNAAQASGAIRVLRLSSRARVTERRRSSANLASMAVKKASRICSGKSNSFFSHLRTALLRMRPREGGAPSGVVSAGVLSARVLSAGVLSAGVLSAPGAGVLSEASGAGVLSAPVPSGGVPSTPALCRFRRIGAMIFITGLAAASSRQSTASFYCAVEQGLWSQERGLLGRRYVT